MHGVKALTLKQNQTTSLLRVVEKNRPKFNQIPNVEQYRLRVLIISENEDNKTLKKFLDSHCSQLHIETTSGIKQARDLIVEFKPTIIILNVDLPDIEELQFVLNQQDSDNRIIGFSKLHNTFKCERRLNLTSTLYAPEDIEHSNGIKKPSFLMALHIQCDANYYLLKKLISF